MSATIRLSVLTGPHTGERFCFRGPNVCTIGRGLDCFVRFVGNPQDGFLSRSHCQLFVDPPVVRAQDLGSANGTYINGRKLGAAPDDNEQAAVFHEGPPIASLRSGDVLTMGHMSMKVDVVNCPPDTPEAQAYGNLWQECETAKKGCPIACR